MPAAMKRPNSRKVDPVQSRCKIIKDAIKGAESCPANVKEMLCSTIQVSVGACKANRHPFNERFVAMIGEVIKAEHARLTGDAASKEGAFNELHPAKATREAAVAQATADAEAKAGHVSVAKDEVGEVGIKLKEAAAALKEAEKAQKVGDADYEVIAGKKAALQETTTDSLGPLVDGSAAEGDKAKKTKAVLDMGKKYSFDASLLTTAEPVLLKEVAERGGFDATCLEQLTAAFGSAVGALDEQLAAGAPGKAERAGVVEKAQAEKTAIEEQLAGLKEKLAAAKCAKTEADAAQKAAAQSLEDFIPDMKNAGDALDQAKEDLKDFTEGAVQAYSELKDLKEGDFQPDPAEEAAKSPKKARVGEAAAEEQQAA